MQLKGICNIEISKRGNLNRNGDLRSDLKEHIILSIKWWKSFQLWHSEYQLYSDFLDLLLSTLPKTQAYLNLSDI